MVVVGMHDLLVSIMKLAQYNILLLHIISLSPYIYMSLIHV
jgi:hypothetical protein